MDARFVRHKLQTVAVSRGYYALVLVVFAGKREGAQYIVCFVALTGHDFIAQKREQLFERSHLGGKLGRHALSRRLVAGVCLVAEGRRFKVKRYCHRVGVFFLFKLFQHGEKAVYCVGKLSVLCGQRTDSVVGAVYNAVSVNNKYSHSLYITSVITPFL